MTPQELIKQYKEKHSDVKPENENKLIEIAVNCLGLSEAWVTNEDKNPSMVLKTYDNDGAEIDTSYGVTKDNLPMALFTLLSQPGKVKETKLFKFVMQDGKSKTTLMGELLIN